MLRDWGSRDTKMINLIQSVRQELLNLAEVSSDEYTTVLIQVTFIKSSIGLKYFTSILCKGSGTFCGNV